MKIEIELKEGWTMTGWSSWREVMEFGWKFVELDKDGYVVMTSNGFSNRFRNKVQ